MHPDFWDHFDDFINSNESFLLSKVGMIGANSYQNYERGLKQVESKDHLTRVKENTNTARGNLLQGILTFPLFY